MSDNRVTRVLGTSLGLVALAQWLILSTYLLYVAYAFRGFVFFGESGLQYRVIPDPRGEAIVFQLVVGVLLSLMLVAGALWSWRILVYASARPQAAAHLATVEGLAVGGFCIWALVTDERNLSDHRSVLIVGLVFGACLLLLSLHHGRRNASLGLIS